MDWPELDDAHRQRAERIKQMRQDSVTNQFVDELEKHVDEQFWVSSQLEMWKHIQPTLDRLIKEWGEPVYRLLSQLARTYWDVDAETERRLKIPFKLVPQGKTLPPIICWEALYSRYYYMGWFVVQLKVNQDGTPIRFCMEVKEGQRLISPLKIDKLKEIMVEAFNTGPLFDLSRKPLAGLTLKID